MSQTTVSIKVNKRQLERVLKAMDPGQAKFAIALATTRTAAIAKDDLVKEMKGVFKSPNKFTLNSAFYIGATKSKLTSVVAIKDKALYLVSEVTGGPRRRKSSESLLNPIIKPKRYLYRNSKTKSPGAEMNKILSYFKVQRDEHQNRTEASTKRKKNPAAFTALQLPGHKGKHIYQRTGKGGRGLKLMYWATKQQRYKKRLNIQGVVRDAMDVHMLRELEKAITHTMETAK